MDIRFDASEAEKLLKEMKKYCSGIQKEARDLLAVLDSQKGWQDNQMIAFQANINELARDLNLALSIESDYMRTFYLRIMELRSSEK